MTDHPLSRRQFAATGLAGLGVALTARGATATRASSEVARSPDHATVLRLLARLHGDLGGRTTFGWYDGAMLVIAPGGVPEPLGRVRGVVARRLRPLTSGAGWNVRQCEVSEAYALPERGDEGFANPITGAVILPAPPVVRRSTFVLDAASTSVPAWSVHDGRVTVETPLRVVERTPGGATRESFTFHFEDHAARGSTAGDAIASVGTLLRMGPSPAWLGMEGAPGHLLYQCRFVGGLAELTAAPVALRRALKVSGDLASLRFGRETAPG